MTNEEMKQLLEQAWKEVFAVNSVADSDDFFEVGGDSIKAIQLASWLVQKGVKVNLMSVFSAPTFGEIAETLEETQPMFVPDTLLDKDMIAKAMQNPSAFMPQQAPASAAEAPATETPAPQAPAEEPKAAEPQAAPAQQQTMCTPPWMQQGGNGQTMCSNPWGQQGVNSQTMCSNPWGQQGGNAQTMGANPWLAWFAWQQMAAHRWGQQQMIPPYWGGQPMFHPCWGCPHMYPSYWGR